MDRQGDTRPPEVQGPTCSISARSGAGVDALLRQIGTLIAAQQQKLCVQIPADRTDLIAILHRNGRVTEESLCDNVFEVTAYVPARIAGRVRKELGA